MKPLPFYLCLTFFLLTTGSVAAGFARLAGTEYGSETSKGEATRFGQPVSSIRGIILDADTRVPLIGVSIVIAGSDPLIGTVSDTMGAYYDPDEDMIDTWTQMGIIPTIIYRVEF